MWAVYVQSGPGCPGTGAPSGVGALCSTPTCCVEHDGRTKDWDTRATPDRRGRLRGASVDLSMPASVPPTTGAGAIDEDNHGRMAACVK
jgi:hypothetical protein